MVRKQNDFTVIGYDEADGKTFADHVQAGSGEEALKLVAQDEKRQGHVLVICIAGRCGEAEHADEEAEKGTLHWPGDGVVDVETYLEMWGEDL